MEKMTLEEIRTWCEGHVTMRSRVVSNDYDGEKIVFPETGESYEYREKYHESNINEKTSRYYINGKLVNETLFHWNCFGWKVINTI